MAAADRPFPERMTWFWHGHFATSIQKVRFADLMATQNASQRRLGTGDFRALAQAMAVDPAMLIWLDGGGNRVGKPNENLAREFMELFTLGVGNYTEDDVRSAARALTGWTVNVQARSAAFVPKRHDPGPETVLGTSVNDTTSLVEPAGRAAGVAAVHRGAGVDPVRLRHPAGPRDARHARQRLRLRPRRHGARCGPPPARPRSATPASVLVREPVLWLVGRVAGAEPARVEGARRDRSPRGLTGLGQVPFAPPNVGGWPAGTPWLTTASALARLNLARAIVNVGDISPVTAAPPNARVAATAALLGLPAFTLRTAAALAPLTGNPPQLVAAALASPESCVSA